MNSVASRRFWDLFNALPADIQKLAVKNYYLWHSNPYHPSIFADYKVAPIVTVFGWAITIAPSVN